MPDHDQLRILGWNSNSIRYKMLELEVLNQRENFDVICLSETKLDENLNLRLPGYACYRLDRNSRGGGVAIMVKLSLRHCEIRLPHLTSLEVIGIKLFSSNKSFSIWSVYKPPKNKLKCEDLNTLFQHENAIVIGDLNCRHQMWNCLRKNTDGETLHKYCVQKSIFIAAPTDPTYIPENPRFNPSILDLALFKDHSHFYDIFSSASLGSNHNPITVTLSLTPLIRENKITFDFKNADWDSFRSFIDSNFNIDTPESKEDIDNAVNSLTSVIQKSMELNIPTKTMVLKSNIPENKLINFLIKTKNRYRKLFQRSRDVRFKKLQNITSKVINRLLYLLRNSLFNKKLSLIKSTDSLWVKKKSIIPRSKCIPPLLTGDSSNDNHCTYAYSPEDKAEILASRFEAVHRLNLNMGTKFFTRKVEEAVSHFLSSKNIDFVDSCAVSTHELLSIIKKLKAKKSPGIDSIPALCIKNLSLGCIVKFKNIVNQILKIGHFPTFWKISKVIAILKPGKSPHKADSYRPISLLCILSKVVEKIILTRFDSFLEHENLLSPEQFGFRTNRSTVGQIARLADHVISNFNVKKHTGMVLLDIEKCFDTVWHAGLIYKLILKKCPTYLVFIFYSYLKDRQLRVCIDTPNSSNTNFLTVESLLSNNDVSTLTLGTSVLSSPKKIAAGVPQGSLVGPKQYIFYTHDAPKVKFVQNAIFADDTGMFTSSWRVDTIINRLHTSSKKYGNYFKKWKIRVNPNKTEAIFFTRRKPLVPKSINVFNSNISWSKHVKYLGVYLDSKLTYAAHMSHIKKKFFASLNSLYPIFNYKSKLNVKNKILIYKSCLRPVITYAAAAWNTTCKTNYKNLQILQNKALRIALRKRRSTKISDLHTEAKISYLDTYISKLSSNFLKKIKTTEIPVLKPLCSYTIPFKTKYKRVMHNVIVNANN